PPTRSVSDTVWPTHPASISPMSRPSTPGDPTNSQPYRGVRPSGPAIAPRLGRPHDPATPTRASAVRPAGSPAVSVTGTDLNAGVFDSGSVVVGTRAFASG